MLATLRSMWDLSSHDQGSNSCLLQWKRKVLTTGLPKKSQPTLILNPWLSNWMLQPLPHMHTHTFLQYLHTLSSIATYDKYSSNSRGVFKTKLGTAHVSTKNISKRDHVSWKWSPLEMKIQISCFGENFIMTSVCSGDSSNEIHKWGTQLLGYRFITDSANTN